jgi:uncharacterized protein (TIGR02246 family)
MATKIRQLVEMYMQATNTGDIDTAVGMFAPDGRMLAPGSPPAVGPEAIRAALGGFAQMKPKLALAPTEEIVAGDIAIEIGTWSLEMQPQGGAPISDHGNDVRVWRRDGDTWKLLVDIWNSEQPPA